MYDTGGMRRTHLRRHDNILKCLLVLAAEFNLSLVLRKIMGIGTARGLQGLSARIFALLRAMIQMLRPQSDPSQQFGRPWRIDMHRVESGSRQLAAA